MDSLGSVTPNGEVGGVTPNGGVGVVTGCVPPIPLSH